MGKNKLLLIGWDAADWKIIGPLLAKGQMPALKSLIDTGVYGNMSTMNPPYSPMLWSSVATGKTPDKHGVLGFIEVMPDLSGVRPVTTTARKSRAIWNILHNKGLKSNLVGWWPSYPAEPINGIVISDKFQKVNPDPKKQSPMSEGTIHPESERDNFLDLRMFPFEITKEHILPFFPNAAKLDQEKNNKLEVFSRIMAHNISVHNATTKLLRTSEWDFMAVYYDMIDHFCHSFMKYHPPRLKGIPEDEYELFNEAIVSSYRFQDMMLERKLQLIDKDTTVIVMSDHGFESGVKRILDMPKIQAAPSLEHRQFGIFVAAGPNIKKNQKVFGLGLVDIAPTILHHYNLPVGKDMDGKVMLDIFEKTKKPSYIDSWDTLEGDFGEHSKNMHEEVLSDQDTMEQLIELGYVEKLDEDKDVAIKKTKCDLKHNLARVYLGKKDFQKAKELLMELINEEDPIDVAPFYLDLITTNINLKDFVTAKGYLETLKNLKTKVRYNLFFPEAEILEGLGHPLKALNLLQVEIKGGTNGELWYRIGRLQYGLSNFQEAVDAFEKAIAIEADRATYHRGMAEALYELEEFEESVEYALTSIELIRYFPSAHYILGKALEKLGDLENAEIAFDTASRLTPRTFYKAEKAFENLQELKEDALTFNDKGEFKHKKDQIVLVSGLPRSGTSLMMQMLDKAGIDILTDGKRTADQSNPKGYYEYEPVMSIHKDNSWLGEAKNKSVKVVAPLLKHLDPKYRYKIIFMKRDLYEIIKSQQKMLGRNADVLPMKLFDAFKKQLQTVDIWKDREPGIELIYVDYSELFDKPDALIDKVEQFIGLPLDKKRMADCIDVSLYRNKKEISKK